MNTPSTSPVDIDPTTSPHHAEAATPRRRRTGAVLAVIGAAAVIGLGIGAAIGPQHQTVGAATAGDEALADRVRALPGSLDGFRSLSVAEVGPDGVVFAGLGDADPAHPGAPQPDTVFELGSITKTFTGALFADAIERGEVEPDDRLAQHLPELDGTPAGDVTLASLAQHSSGLPGLGATAGDAAAGNIIFNENAYATTTTDQLVADAAAAPVDPDQGAVYSNFAVSLLGTALAEAAGADDYAALLAERLTGPLGMDRTTVAATADEVPDDAVPGFLLNGTPAPRWWGSGYLPAGASTFTTAEDLAIWAQANLDGTAPGAAALEPTAPMGETAEIGWAWITSPSFDGEGTQVWHNGGTAGFRTILVLDREAQTAVIVLSNTVAPADFVAMSLAAGTPVDATDDVSLTIGWVVFGLALLLGAIALFRALRARALLPSISDLVWATFALLLLWRHGPWFTVGGWVWGLALAPALAALAVLVIRAARGGLPFLPRRRAWFWWPMTVIGAGLAVGVTFLW
ncbi:serine hydrolase [Streptomyces sp. AC495_CC817]|uniref:serine hydrolase domain-containing protein n=1 Tax=Streptomyces sp. AC495_CC817 TaxID=2823900 RepID=UPI001C259C53|nr:serine hydrolase domain-containing protein [Streptomyces sp. AC495_CC817]